MRRACVDVAGTADDGRQGRGPGSGPARSCAARPARKSAVFFSSARSRSRAFLQESRDPQQ
eukprot:5193764-Pyramimonas_sp.AAC.1